MRSKSAALMSLLYFRRAGDIRARYTRETGEEPMTAIRSEKIESTDVDDPSIAAVTEVEAGIRDFVRNDVAYLRRPPHGGSGDTALEPDAEATRHHVHSLIQRVAGTSLSAIRNLDSALVSLRDL